MSRCCSLCGEEFSHFLRSDGDLVCFDCFQSPAPGNGSNRFLDEITWLSPDQDLNRFVSYSGVADQNRKEAVR
jgi:hypothetical protein